MRTSHHFVSSAGRLSSWLIALLGLAVYVGVIYALTLVPVQFEVPLPSWGAAVIPPVAYAVLVWVWVRRPSVLRWLVGTGVLSGLHLLIGLSREPLTALLDPALAGRPLPWVLPPPLPELIGIILLLVPLRDVLRTPVRLARERVAGAGRPSSSLRGRATAPPRVQPASPTEGSTLSEVLLSRSEPVPAAPIVAPPASPPPAEPEPEQEPRRRRAAERAERRREAEPTRPSRRADVMLRIALDRVMGQLPPGTFLAPEDEVAASLRDPGYLRISGELVVTQLSEGVARVAWVDIADQFPPHLVGLSKTEISEHLGDGLRLPLDEVIGQLPHELFVADTPALEISGLDRIPVPFHPLEESSPAPDPLCETEQAIEPAREGKPTPEIKTVSGVERPPGFIPPEAPTPSMAPAAPVVVAPPAAPEIGEPTVRISFGRVASEIPAEAFRVPLDQLAERMWQPGWLLIPQSVVLPQLGEGLIQVTWDVVAPQFPRGEMAVSDAEMAERLPNGIRLPLDEIIRQVPPDLFMVGGPAADVRGLENFPAPFQPLLSDPAPAPPPPAAVAEAMEPILALPEPAPVLVALEEPVAIAVPEPVVEETSGRVESDEIIGPDRPLAVETTVVVDEPEPVVVPPISADEPTPAPEPRWTEPAPARAATAWPEPVVSEPTAATPVPGAAEMAQARRIVALLAPIASFDVSVQAVEGVTIFAMASPTVAQETAAAVAGLALPVLMDRRLPWRVDQLTLRGPETALVLTPLGGPRDRGPVLAAAVPRGGTLALLEILCRRAAHDGARRTGSPASDPFPVGTHGLAPAPVPSRAAGLAPSLTAFGDVTASVLRDAESEAVLYFFLPAGGDVPAVGAFAQDLQAVMRKAAGSGAVFRTAILRSGDTLLVIQPEEIGHGRSIVIVAGGPVTRPGLAYRQVERAAATLMSA